MPEQNTETREQAQPRTLEYWRQRAGVTTPDLTAAGITNESPVFAWMKARGWATYGVIGRVETGFFHKESRSRLTIQGWHSLDDAPDALVKGPRLAAMLVANDRAYCKARGECPQDALDDLIEFGEGGGS